MRIVGFDTATLRFEKQCFETTAHGVVKAVIIGRKVPNFGQQKLKEAFVIISNGFNISTIYVLRWSELMLM